MPFVRADHRIAELTDAYVSKITLLAAIHGIITIKSASLSRQGYTTHDEASR